LTSQRFTANPFVRGAHDRLYRTGDLARFLEDGSIEFLGRADHQVKIRGHRIELQEIEQVLAEHPDVGQAAVTLLDERLVGYVVPSQASGELNHAALRDHLRDRLPDYMVPGELMTLERLPLTPNGKLDRKALPVPDRGEMPAGPAFVAPGTPTELALAELWQDVLRVDRVGIEDNFFDLGGHSLLAMQLVSRARKALSIELPLREIFAAPTLSQLSARVDAIRTARGPMPRISESRERISL
jgi:acyl carrier protein